MIHRDDDQCRRQYRPAGDLSVFFGNSIFSIALRFKLCYYIWAVGNGQPEYPGVAQMVARLNGVQEAAGSNPVTRTKTLKSLMISAFSFCSLLKNCTLDF